MAGHFLDSSAVAKLYHEEAGSGELRSLLERGDARFYISRLTVVEVHSVFAGKVRGGIIALEDVDALRSRFLADMRDRQLRVSAVTASHYEEAETLIRVYGVRCRLRTLDALQLAVGLDLMRRRLVSQFIAADAALCRTAEEAGFPVWNPEAGPAG